ncbi:peptidase M23-like protein [Motilibacter rhizosphaerae]|uniref:Peptidase M23-like protein n=1 Tax=Motilibacter rhizosphaerae TaxID=598652 RepID=A0A4V2F4S1_9ACTN|nr:M23 family metallopeptidase [Motilibacter rhizosphaerae]RZS90299.1 peptidase M23-like protein [Motilibacter rhizosphaerae]
MAARRRSAGKHRRPGKHRAASSTHPSPPVLVGTAVLATAAAAWFSPTTALGSTRDAAVHRTSPEPGPTPTELAAAASAVQAQAAGAATAGSRFTAPAAKARSTARQRASRSAARIALQDAVATPQWVKPVDRYTLTAHFGEGGGLWSHGHTGQDFAAPTGTPVHAVGAGVVVSAQRDGAYGNKIVLQHADGTQTWYCHLSAFLVSPGDKVTTGEEIGRVGATGNTTGPHLHLEVRPTPDQPVDPMPWLRAHGVEV